MFACRFVNIRFSNLNSYIQFQFLSSVFTFQLSVTDCHCYNSIISVCLSIIKVEFIYWKRIPVEYQSWIHIVNTNPVDCQGWIHILNTNSNRLSKFNLSIYLGLPLLLLNFLRLRLSGCHWIRLAQSFSKVTLRRRKLLSVNSIPSVSAEKWSDSFNDDCWIFVNDSAATGHDDSWFWVVKVTSALSPENRIRAQLR